MSRFILAAAMAATLATLAGGCDLPLSDGPPVVGQGDSNPPTPTAGPVLGSPWDGDRLAYADRFTISGMCTQKPCRIWFDVRPANGGGASAKVSALAVMELTLLTAGGLPAPEEGANGGSVIPLPGLFRVQASGLVPGYWTLTVGQGSEAVQTAPPWSQVLSDSSEFEVYEGNQ